MSPLQPTMRQLQLLAGQGDAMKRMLSHYLRGVMGSRWQGAWKTAFRGQGMEFHSVREYAYGDEVRHMDWRVTARTGKPHLKQFMEDRQRFVWLLLDDRPAMHFGTHGTFKHIQQAQVAALLAGAALAAGERVGGLLARLDDAPTPQQRSVRLWRCDMQKGGKGLAPFFGLLCGQEAVPVDSFTRTGDRCLLQAMDALVHVPALTVGGRPKCFILSDFLDIRLRDQDQALAECFRHLAAKMEITVIQIWDTSDETLPDAGWLALQTTQGKPLTVNLSDATLQKQWQQWAQARQQWLQHTLAPLGIRFMRISTQDDPRKALAHGLRHAHPSHWSPHPPAQGDTSSSSPTRASHPLRASASRTHRPKEA